MVNNTANLRRSVSAGLENFLRREIDLVLLDLYLAEMQKVENRTSSYFRLFGDINSRTVQNVKNSVIVGLDNIFNDNTIQRQITQSLNSSIRGEAPIGQVRARLTEQIKGDDNRLGVVESFHYQNSKDTFASYDRQLTKDVSADLDLNYFIYQGGEIDTTRPFCDTRNGNVYNREEIDSWNNLEWQGKKQGHNIWVDVGGYNCRHYFDAISYELAQLLRPDIPKSKFD